MTLAQVNSVFVLSSFMTVTVGVTTSPFFESEAVAVSPEPVAPVQVYPVMFASVLQPETVHVAVAAPLATSTVADAGAHSHPVIEAPFTWSSEHWMVLPSTLRVAEKAPEAAYVAVAVLPLSLPKASSCPSAEFGIVQLKSAFCCAVIPAIPAGERRLNVHTVDAPFSITAGFGSHVPLTVPSATIDEELAPMDAELGIPAELEKLMIAELPGTGTVAEDELSPGSTIGVDELEDGAAADETPFSFPAQAGFPSQASIASLIRPAYQDESKSTRFPESSLEALETSPLPQATSAPPTSVATAIPTKYLFFIRKASFL